MVLYSVVQYCAVQMSGMSTLLLKQGLNDVCCCTKTLLPSCDWLQGILRADAPLCNETQGADQTPEWWKEETFLKEAWITIKHLTAPRSL